MCPTTEIIQSAISDATETLVRNSRLLSAIPTVTILFQEIEKWESFKDVDVYGARVTPAYCGDVDALVSLELAEGKESSSLVRDLVRYTGEEARKTKTYSGNAFDATLTWNRVKVGVKNYRPESCHIEWEDVLVPAQPERVEKRPKMVCTNNEE